MLPAPSIISYFTSKTCTPCKRLLPQVHDLLAKTPGLVLREYDIDDFSLTAQQAGVQAVPTILFTSDNDEKLSAETYRLLPTQATLRNIRTVLGVV